MNLEGNWTETIIYGKIYREDEGRELFFDLRVSSQKGNTLIGEATDTMGFGKNPYTASIKGRINNNRIQFVKPYPFERYLNESKEYKTHTSRKGHKVHYTGVYDSIGEEFTGNWVIYTWIWLFGLIPLRFRSYGTWNMRRENQDI